MIIADGHRSHRELISGPASDSQAMAEAILGAASPMRPETRANGEHVRTEPYSTLSGGTFSIPHLPSSTRAETRAHGEQPGSDIHRTSPAVPRVTASRDSLIVIGRRDANT